MTGTRAERIFQAVRAVQKSKDESQLLQVLFRDALNWPIEVDEVNEIELDDITYDWPELLPDSGLEDKDGPVQLRQIMPFDGWPLGIFFVKFGSGRFFEQGRGMTGPLREILRKLSTKARPKSGQHSWNTEQLLFICHSEVDYLQFARFSDSEDGGKKSRLKTFGFAREDEIRTLCEYNLSNLYYDPRVTGKDALDKIASAFSVSKVGDGFYKHYRSTLDSLTDSIATIQGVGQDTAESLSKSLLHRLMFVRFLEKKRGWLRLGDQTDDRYLLNLYQESIDSGEDFYESRLRPLFFEGLSIDGKQKSEIYGEVVYVNGSLFQEANDDKFLSGIDNTVFKPIIGSGSESLLYSWNITVTESTPLAQEVAINPEMLGIVFEKTATEGMGAFYTPGEVVSYMCKEGIADFLKTRTEVDADRISRLVHEESTDGLLLEEASEIRERLYELRAIDPACGSGAYLVGLLNEIILVHNSLSTHPEADDSLGIYDLKFRIIRDSIFGSDIDAGAVEIAKLRLWLALIVAADEPIALPNLDFKIEVGDSLCAPSPEEIPYLRPNIIEQAEEIYAKMADQFGSGGPEGRKLKEEIEHELVVNNEDMRGEDYYSGSTDFLGRFMTIFTKNGGFDLVLTNPPYVRQEDLTSDFKRQLAGSYGVGSQIPEKNVSGLTRRSDLYCYFYVRAMQLLRNGGTQIFICSNSWLDVDFGIPLKQLMAKRNRLTRVVDSTRERQFQSAAVNTILTFAKKGLDGPDNTKFDNLTGAFEESVYDDEKIETKTIDGDSLDPKSKWSRYTRAPGVYFEALESGPFERLDKFGLITRGFTSGANDFFFIPKGTRPDIEDRFLKPVIKTPREVTGIMVNEGMLANEVFLCSPSKTILKDKFQGAHAYVKQGEEKEIEIKRGKDRGTKIVGYNSLSTTKSRPQWHTLPELKRADVLMRQFYNDKFDFPLNPHGFPCDHTFYYIHMASGVGVQTPETESKHQKKVLRLGSYLNSSMSWLFVEVLGRKNMGEGVLTCYGPEMRPFPVLDPDKLEGVEDLFEPLTERPVESVFDELGIDPDQPVSGQTPNPKPDRKALDDFVFDVVGLSEEQRTQVYLSLCEMVQNRLYKAKNIL